MFTRTNLQLENGTIAPEAQISIKNCTVVPLTDAEGNVNNVRLHYTVLIHVNGNKVEERVYMLAYQGGDVMQEAEAHAQAQIA